MVLSLLVATAAMAPDVGYNFDADTHFEKFKTYKWVEIKDSQKIDELKDKEIKGVLDAALAKKRLTKTDADSADLYIGNQPGVEAEKQSLLTTPIGDMVRAGTDRVGGGILRQKRGRDFYHPRRPTGGGHICTPNTTV